MADLFISYAREDRPRAEALAKTLEAQGYDVFWDSEIPPGKSWADYLESKLRACKAMLVLWSNHSIGSQWVREEARVGRDSGKLIPVLLDNASPPFGFGEVQAANLTTWQGEPEHADWKRLLAAIAQATGDQPEAPTARATTPPPQQGFQQPPQQPPQQGFQPQQPEHHSAQNFQHQTASSGAQASAKMSPMDAIRKCLANYANGKGRAGKAEFWWFLVFAICIYILGYVIDAAMFGMDYDGNLLAPIVSTVLSLGMAPPLFSVASRRLHDAGINGWVAILMIIPLAFIVVGFLPGKPEANEYGPPLA